MYLGKPNPRIEAMIDPKHYDYIFMLKPDVE
jgi:nicotinamide riboside kinase